jgi:hypothetical protein
MILIQILWAEQWLRVLGNVFSLQTLNSIPGEFMGDSWWMKWHRSRFLSKSLWFFNTYHSTTVPYARISAPSVVK